MFRSSSGQTAIEWIQHLSLDCRFLEFIFEFVFKWLWWCLGASHEACYWVWLGLMYWFDLWCQSAMPFTTCVIESLLEKPCERRRRPEMLQWNCLFLLECYFFFSKSNEWIILEEKERKKKTYCNYSNIDFRVLLMKMRAKTYLYTL